MYNIRVVNYSILGMQLPKYKNLMIHKALPPDINCLFVDPAGLDYIQKFGPSNAGGASGAIYRYIGIYQDNSFPKKVQINIRKVGDAYWYVYNRIYNCCHVIGPNFTIMNPQPTKNQAIDLLTRVYQNIFGEFVRSQLTSLRLLPVSGGIYSGQFKEIMPEITFIAINNAINKLTKKEVEFLILHKNNIEMCILDEVEVNSFRIASKLYPTNL